MGYTYEWKVTGVKKVNSENIDEAIIGTQWKVVCTDEDGATGEFIGATPFDLKTINTGSFTAYADLTEEQVLGWIKNVVSGSNPGTNYWHHIQGQMDKQIEKTKLSFTEVSDVSLPWSPTSGSSVTPDPLAKDY
jgi:subtilase family serine protease